MAIVKRLLSAAVLVALVCLLFACPPGVNSPVIAIEGPDSVAIADGGSYDFGSVSVGSTAEAVFTVRNTGTASLALDGTPVVQITGSGASQFSLSAEPQASVDASGSTTFTLTFAPVAEGAATATVSIPNNDADLAFTLNGTGVSSAYPDTDGDGAPDYLEQALGTGINDPADNPASHGYHVAILPKGGSPSPATLSFTYAPAVSTVDVFILLDATASMTGAHDSLKNSFTTTIAPSLGSMGKDAAVGIGSYRDFPDTADGYGAAGDYPFALHHRVLTIRGSAAVTSLDNKLDNAIVIAGGADNPEASWEALYQVAVGNGTTQGTASVPAWDASSAFPTSTPSGEAAGSLPGVGFRDGSLPCVVWITDAVGHNSALYSHAYSGISSPTASQTVAALVNAGCRVIGINIGGEAEAHADMLYAVNGTNARVPTTVVDSTEASTYSMTADSGKYPLLYTTNWSVTGLQNVLVSGVQHLVEHGAFDAALSAQDDDSDSVDAPAAFISRLVASPTAGQSATDTNSDGDPDTYSGLAVGESAGFTVKLKSNGTVSQKASAQVFTADLHLRAGSVELGTQKIYFVVPPTAP
jgi:hypothetical protein